MLPSCCATSWSHLFPAARARGEAVPPAAPQGARGGWILPLGLQSPAGSWALCLAQHRGKSPVQPHAVRLCPALVGKYFNCLFVKSDLTKSRARVTSPSPAWMLG